MNIIEKITESIFFKDLIAKINSLIDNSNEFGNKVEFLDEIDTSKFEYLDKLEEVDSKASKTELSNAITNHNVNETAHNDIRLLIQGLATRLNALADSDDVTLDQLREIVAYIKANKSLIESVTTSKVSVSDIIDNLESSVSNKPLSAAQGVALKQLIDVLAQHTSGWVTPQMYGAKADGVSDDTNAFIEAITNSNGYLFIPNGDYLITSTLTISKQVTIEGSGCEGTILHYTGDGYLFDISTNAKNRAVIKNIYARGTTANSFINCSNGTWGASFTLENCYIVLFDNKIFNFVSAFGTNVRNTRIISRGIINTEPYNNDLPFGDTLTNVHNWENVYYTGNKSTSESEVPISMFHLNNAQYFSFHGCAFEAVNTIFELSNYTQEILLYGCNIEQTTNLYIKKDATAKIPKFINTNTSVSKYDANSEVLDLLKDEPSKATILRIHNGTSNGMNDLFDNPSVTLFEKTARSPGQSVEYLNLYRFTTHGAEFMLPVNLKRVVENNVSSISYNLWKSFSLNVGFMVDVDALMIYSDGSRRWVSSSIFGQQINSKAYISRTEIKMVTTEGSLADQDLGIFSLSGSNIILNSDFTCSSIILVVRHNTTGRVLFN